MNGHWLERRCVNAIRVPLTQYLAIILPRVFTHTEHPPEGRPTGSQAADALPGVRHTALQGQERGLPLPARRHGQGVTLFGVSSSHLISLILMLTAAVVNSSVLYIVGRAPLGEGAVRGLISLIE